MDSTKPQPKAPTPRQEQTRRVMKAYLSAPIETRHEAAKEAQRRGSQNEEDPLVPIKPEEDARLPSLEAEIESHWRSHRKAFVKELTKMGILQKSIKNTALDCVRILQEY